MSIMADQMDTIMGMADTTTDKMGITRTINTANDPVAHGTTST
jgi:hypothetical protein